jgi:hypothetical protein
MPMPSRAFVPAALIEAQPRVYKSFRGRQLQGLLMGAGGAALMLAVFGVRDFSGYALAFVAALPGFAYGYYQPQGRPLEYWLRVQYRYFASAQRLTAVRPRRPWSVLRGQIDPVLRACRWYLTLRRER